MNAMPVDYFVEMMRWKGQVEDASPWGAVKYPSGEIGKLAVWIIVTMNQSLYC